MTNQTSTVSTPSTLNPKNGEQTETEDHIELKDLARTWDGLAEAAPKSGKWPWISAFASAVALAHIPFAWVPKAWPLLIMDVFALAVVYLMVRTQKSNGEGSG